MTSSNKEDKLVELQRICAERNAQQTGVYLVVTRVGEGRTRVYAWPAAQRDSAFDYIYSVSGRERDQGDQPDQS